MKIANHRLQQDGDWRLADILDGNRVPQASGWVHGAYIQPVD